MKKLVKRKGKHTVVGGKNKVSYESGEPQDMCDIKHITPTEGTSVVGLSKGATINLGDYESARIDCWISTVVPDSEVSEAISDISQEIDEILIAEAELIAGMIRGD